jgi:hypothetical protein
LRVRDLQIEQAGDRATLNALVTTESRHVDDFQLDLEWRGMDPAHELRVGDTLLAFLLVPAMACNETLDLGSLSVSQRLLRSVPRIQDTYLGWSDGLSYVSVRAQAEPRRRERAGTGLFFSGGIDSWYSLLAADPPPTHLLFMVGFDIDESQPHRLEQASRTAREVADKFGATLITSRANLRAFTDPLVEWSLYHGGYLAGTALAVGADLTTCLISSSNSRATVRPYGSHPELDSLWSTESLTVDHAGFEEGRLDKIKRVSQEPVALRTLRVCWQPVDEYNCGRCPKCALAMTALHLMGKLEDSTTFPATIDLEALAAIRQGGSAERWAVLKQLIALAEEQGEEDIAKALNKARRSAYLDPRKYIDAAEKRLHVGARRRARLRR